jgi:F-type H+-transporting ATPase subunit a
MVYFHPSISSTILTMWIVMALILLLAFVATRRMKTVPGRLQNVVEWAYEFGSDFAVGIGGERARRYYPIFAGFFIFILFSNWSGLVPPVGKIEQLRAPTSDVNITLGLALTSFVLFQGEGFRRLGVRGYLGKFFPLGEFRKGIGAGVLAMYVGIIELFLEFVKPVTLSMRLFGNIYGGEVALAVISALTLAVVPVALIGLEALLNLIQALIFSVLTLMFILIAIEGHGSEEHRPADAGHTRVNDAASGGADNTQAVAA